MTRVWCVLEAFVTRIYAKGKRFDVAAMIPADTYTYGKFILPGPALRMDLGDGALQEVAEPEHGMFPGTVAVAGVAVKVELAEASREEDRKGILHMLAKSKDKAADPPRTCSGYDDVNNAYCSLFSGPAMFEMAMDGDSESLRQLLVGSSQAVNYQNPNGS